MKKIIWIFIVILIFMIIGGILIIYSVFGNNRYNLKNISDSQKEEIMELLNCTEISKEIKLNEMQVPKEYRDIYYQIYFETNNKDIKKYIIASDIYGRDLKELKNNNYCCTIYRNDDKSIDILEVIRKGKLPDNANKKSPAIALEFESSDN